MNALNRLASLSSACLFLAAAGTVHAAVDVTFNFDSVPAGSNASLVSQAGIQFLPAVFAPLVDSSGLPIEGTDGWRPDSSGVFVTVDNPATFGRGTAPSPLNALNALFQPVLLEFSSPEVIRRLSVSLDNDTFGTRDSALEFFSSDNRLLGTIVLDQTQAGLVVNADLDLTGVAKVLLPAGAFYDNLVVSSIPEPGASRLLAFGAVALAVLARRRS